MIATNIPEHDSGIRFIFRSAQAGELPDRPGTVTARHCKPYAIFLERIEGIGDVAARTAVAARTKRILVGRGLVPEFPVGLGAPDFFQGGLGDGAELRGVDPLGLSIHDTLVITP